jgi:DNA topoisomerase IB
VIELVARSAIRPGSENYARLRGTRGAATLLKSNVSVYGETVKLRFKAKGGKLIEKEIQAPKLASAVHVLQQLPGHRLFQYRNGNGALHAANAREVNRFLRELAGVNISLKDFRNPTRFSLGAGCTGALGTRNQQTGAAAANHRCHLRGRRRAWQQARDLPQELRA